jgi:radical SAM enzyme (TIGR01210 family)
MTLPLIADEWVLARRPARSAVSADHAYAHLVEEEPIGDGRMAEVVTIFLTNRECPFRCVMCDLWKNTLTESVRVGQIPGQIREVLAAPRSAVPRGYAEQWIKLYNAGSFFDPNAIPPDDHPAIAELVNGFDRVIVECHPRLVGRRCLEFQRMLVPRLEVAMGLETVHPEVLPRLNKRMTLDDFAGAARSLRERGASVRAFIMIRPPFLSDTDGLEWAKRSLDFAFSVGVECCSLIPTRGGNGAMEELAALGHFAPSSLESVIAAFEYGLGLGAGRVFLDLWDIEKLGATGEQIKRFERMNRTQVVA